MSVTKETTVQAMKRELAAVTEGSLGSVKSKDVIRACECSYRRGFQQGVAEVVRQIEDGRTTAEVRAWMDGALERWRYHAPRSQQVFPPSFPARGRA